MGEKGYSAPRHFSRRWSAPDEKSALLETRRSVGYRPTDGSTNFFCRQKSSILWTPTKNKAPGWVPCFLAEEKGFEPLCLLGKRFSRPPRYDHFDTSPNATMIFYHKDFKMSISKLQLFEFF